MDKDKLFDGDTQKKNPFTVVIEKIMFAVLAIIPFGLVVLKTGRDYLKLQFGFQFIVAVMVLCTLVVCLMLAHALKNSEKSHAKSICISLFLIGFALRVITCYILQNEPVSDFEQCYNYAVGEPSNISFLAKFPYLGACALTIKVLFLFVPKSVFWAQCFNAAVTASIPVMLYWTILRLTDREDAAFLGGAFYAFYPGLIVYTAIPSCEHFSQFFIALMVLAFVYAKSERKGSMRSWMLYVGCGMSLGLMNLYKELFIVVVPAILMASFCYEVIPAVFKFRNQARRALKKVAMIVCWNLIVVFCAQMVYHAGVSMIQMELQGHVGSRKDPIGLPIYRGLALEGRGLYDSEVNDEVSRIVAQAESSGEANRMLIQKLIDEYREDPFEIIKVSKDKLLYDWCDEGVYYYWTCHGEDNLLKGTMLGQLLFGTIATHFWMYISAILSVGLILQLFKKTAFKNGQGFFVIVGIVFLFVLMLILIEAQGRYKSSIMPLICMMAGMMMMSITDSASMFVNRIKLRVFKN